MISIKSYADALKAAAEAVFEYYTSETGTFYYGYREDVNQARNVYPIIVAERGRFPLVTVRDKGYRITQNVLIGKLATETDVNSDIDTLQEYANYFIQAIDVQSFLKVGSIHSAMEMVQTPKGFMPDNSVWIMFNIEIEAWGCESELLPVPGGVPPPGTVFLSEIFTEKGQIIYADEDLNPVVLDAGNVGDALKLSSEKLPAWAALNLPTIYEAYTVVVELPEFLPVGFLILYNSVLYRGILSGESSLPAGTPIPITEIPPAP